MDPKKKKLLLILVPLLIAVAGIVLAVSLYLSYQSQDIRQEAWQTEQSAIARCDQNGNVEFSISFTNTERPSSNLSMNVIAKDSISGKTVDLGTIRPGESKSGTISLGATTTARGTIRFDLTWTSGRSGTDVRAVSYATLTCQMQTTPSPTPTPLITPTPTPVVSPTPTPIVTPTPRPAPSPTPVAACGSTCVTSEDCLAGMACSAGVCRNSLCTSSTTCLCATATPTPTATPTATPPVTPTPTPVIACNSLCTSTAGCPSDLICSSGYCRRPGCTAVDTCNCGPVVTPTPIASIPEPTTEPLPQAGSVTQTVTLITGGIILLLIAVLTFGVVR